MSNITLVSTDDDMHFGSGYPFTDEDWLARVLAVMRANPYCKLPEALMLVPPDRRAAVRALYERWGAEILRLAV